MKNTAAQKTTPRKATRVFTGSLAAACAITLLGSSAAHASFYYWDTNGNSTAGLGDTAGTWGTSSFLIFYHPANRGLFTGTGVNTGGVTGPNTTTTGDIISFGSINLALGSTASNIGIAAAGVSIGSIIFGAGQTTPVTLSGGGGSITLGFGASIIVNNTSDTIGAVLAGGSFGLAKAGAGTLTLTGENTYAGTTSVRGGGLLTIGNGTTGSVNGTTGTALTFNSGGGVFNVAEAAGSSQGMGALTFSAGDATVTSTAATASSTATLTFASINARAAGATGNFTLATNTTASQNKIFLNDSTSAPVDVSGSNDRGLFFGGTEYARFDSTNGYFRAVIYGTDANTSALVATGATLGIDDVNNDIKITGNITAQTTASVNTINLASNSLTLQDTSQILSVNGIISSGGSIATAGTMQSTSSGGEMVFNVTSGTLTVAPVIQDNTAASPLTKSGAGVLTLAGVNTYTGITTINAGTLSISGGSSIADTGAVVLANKAGVTFLLNANETIGNLSGGGYSGGVVDVQGNTLALGDIGDQLFGGTFTGTAGGAITKQGVGTLSLSNVNTFPGTINLTAGTLAFTLGNSGTTTVQSLSSGGPINMAGATTMSFVPTAQIELGQANNNNPSQLTAPNGWTIGNPITITSGTATFRFTQNGSRWNFTGGVTGGTSGSQTLNILQGTPDGGGGDSQAILFSGVIQNGSGGSTLGVSVDFTASSGVAQTAFVNLSGANTFTGPLTVANTRGLTSGAYLTIGGERTSNSATAGITAGTGSLGTTSPGIGNYTNTISLATGTVLNYASSANQTLSGVISGAGQIVVQGAGGTLTLTGNNTYTGATIHTLLTTATTIRAGTLSAGSLNSVVGGSASSNLGAPTTVANGTIAIGSAGNGAQLTYTGTGETTDRVIDLKGTTGGATIDQSGTGLLKFTSNFTATGAGSKTLVLQGSNAGTGEIAGNIVNNSATNTTSVTKQGTGTWSLSGAKSYTGVTNVNGGTLNVNGTLGAGANVVNANATTNFGVSQTLAALNIGAGAVVTLTATPPFAPLAGDALSGPTSVVVPEPGSIGLLLVGSLGLLARRRRP